jgi:hypothetical protein
MEIKEIIQFLIEQYQDPGYKRKVSDALNKLSTKIIKDINYQEDSKFRVLNLFLLDAYRSYKSFVLLFENEYFSDLPLLCRKMVEILIKIEYLSITNTFDDFCREKSNEQAKTLHSLLISHHIKHVSELALWKSRYRIIEDCKKIHNDKLNGKFQNTPSVEQMAETAGMMVMYKSTYGPLSKFVHSNMIIENYYLYELDNKLHYDIEETNIGFRKMVEETWHHMLYCFYLIIVKYCSELNIYEEQIADFNKEFYLFVSLDLLTGRSKSNIDISKNFVKSLTGIELDKHNVGIEEVMFMEEDISKDTWIKLEKLIQQKESEFQNL